MPRSKLRASTPSARRRCKKSGGTRTGRSPVPTSFGELGTSLGAHFAVPHLTPRQRRRRCQRLGPATGGAVRRTRNLRRRSLKARTYGKKRAKQLRTRRVGGADDASTSSGKLVDASTSHEDTSTRHEDASTSSDTSGDELVDSSESKMEGRKAKLHLWVRFGLTLSYITRLYYNTHDDLYTANTGLLVVDPPLH